MKYINKITDSAKQNITLITEDGKSVNFNLYYVPTQLSWFCDVAVDSFVANGVKLVVSPNLLRQFRNVITFGLAVMSVDGYDPRYIDDFVNSRIQVYTINAAEVQQVEAGIY